MSATFIRCFLLAIMMLPQVVMSQSSVFNGDHFSLTAGSSVSPEFLSSAGNRENAPDQFVLLDFQRNLEFDVIPGRPPQFDDLTLSGNFDFGTVDLLNPQSVLRRVTITNSSGLLNSSFTPLQVSYPDGFSPAVGMSNTVAGVVSECQRPLSNGESCSFDVVYSPQNAGNFSGQIAVGYQWQVTLDEVSSPSLIFWEVAVADFTADATLDFPESQFDVSPVSLSGVEGDVLTLSVTRSGSADALRQSAVVDFALSESLVNDVVVQSDSSVSNLVWRAGESGEQSIQIVLVSDELGEPSEEGELQLLITESVDTPDSSVSATRSTSIPITIQDVPPPVRGAISFVSSTVVVSEFAGIVQLPVERAGGTDGDVSVAYTITADTAQQDFDYFVSNGIEGELSWADGVGGSQSIDINIVQDDVFDEGTETFTVRLFNPVGLSLGAIQEVTVQITDDVPENIGFQSSLVSLSGDEFSAVPGQLLTPLTIELNTDAELDDPYVEWRASPIGAVEFLQGTASELGASQFLDTNYRATMEVRVLSRGLIQLTAVPRNGDNALIGDESSELQITIRSGFSGVEGLNANQRSTGGVLDSVCDQLDITLSQSEAFSVGEQDLFDTCQQLSILDPLEDSAKLAQMLDRLAPEEVFYFSDAVIDAADIQLTNIYARINAIRSRLDVDEAVDVSQLNISIDGEVIPGSVLEAIKNTWSGSGGASSADTPSIPSRFGVFANGEISSGEIDGNGIERDADLDSMGVTVGVDYRVNNNVVIGAGLGLTSNDTDFTGGEGDASTDGLNLALFGTWYETDKGYFDAVLDLGQYDYDMRRRIDLPGDPAAQFANSNTDSSAVSFSVGAGRTFNVSGWEFGPYVNLSLISGSVNGYSETLNDSNLPGAGSLLDIRSHSIRSSQFALGWNVTRAISLKKGVFLPRFAVELALQNEDRKDPVDAVFQNDAGQNVFRVEGQKRDTEYLNIGLGGSLLLQNGRSGFIFYENRAQNDSVSLHSLKLGVRIEF